MNPMRKELLEAIQMASLPMYVGPPDLSPAQMHCLNDMIDEHWIEGHPMLHSSGSGFARIQIIRIRDAGLHALAESKIEEQQKPRKTASTMKSQIFVSYARPDHDVVRSIVRFVKAAEFPTWFAHDNLLAGHDWRHVIKQEIAHSRLLLLCLSTHSVDRTGVFQKEMRLAVEQAELRPQSKVFIMGASLDWMGES